MHCHLASSLRTGIWRISSTTSANVASIKHRWRDIMWSAPLHHSSLTNAETSISNPGLPLAHKFSLVFLVLLADSICSSRGWTVRLLRQIVCLRASISTKESAAEEPPAGRTDGVEWWSTIEPITTGGVEPRYTSRHAEALEQPRVARDQQTTCFNFLANGPEACPVATLEEPPWMNATPL